MDEVQAQLIAQRQTEIMEQLVALMTKVDENSTQVKLLRIELGLDSMHGRIPILETNFNRHDLRMDKMDVAIERLKESEAEDAGRSKLLTGAIALLGGGVAGALIEVAAHMFIK
jgi:hypothetical protein